MKQISATVIANTELTAGHHLITVTAPDMVTEAQPGQFMAIGCGPDFVLRRPISVHQLDKPDKMFFLFRVVGPGTMWLSQRHKGETLDLLGPLGNGFSIKPSSKKLLLAAGGMGIAPLVFLARKALDKGKHVRLLMGVRTGNQLYPERLLPQGLETFIATEDGSYGEKGKLTDILAKYVDWADQIYACGPLAMYQSISEQYKQWRDKKPVQVSLEVRMGCGIGACLCCSIKTKKGMKQVCRDGPVFNLNEVLLEEVKI